MAKTTTITIPTSWLEGHELDEQEIYLALQLGLEQLRQQRTSETATKTVQALLSTGIVRHLAAAPPSGVRQEPPVLPGPPVSEILISQRRGES
jgi:hypothetical protein